MRFALVAMVVLASGCINASNNTWPEPTTGPPSSLGPPQTLTMTPNATAIEPYFEERREPINLTWELPACLWAPVVGRECNSEFRAHHTYNVTSYKKVGLRARLTWDHPGVEELGFAAAYLNITYSDGVTVIYGQNETVAVGPSPVDLEVPLSTPPKNQFMISAFSPQSGPSGSGLGYALPVTVQVKGEFVGLLQCPCP